MNISRELKARDKRVQKMTRDGAIEENKATGEMERISQRDTAPVLSQQPEAQNLIQPEQLLKPPLPLSGGGEKQDNGLTERVIDRINTEHTHNKNKQTVKKANALIRKQSQEPGAKSSRLQFTDEERTDPKLSKHIHKSDRAADKLDAARGKIPKQRKPHIERAFDEKSGKSKARLRFEETDKPVNGKMKHNVASRPAQELGVAVHSEIHKVEHENAGVEGAHKAEQLVERTGGYASRKIKEGYRRHKLQPYRAAAKAEKQAFKANVNVRYQQSLKNNPELAAGNPLSKALQKRKIRKEYAKAVRNGTAKGVKNTAATAKKTAKTATKSAQKTGAFIARHWKGVAIIIAAILLIVFLFAGISSCSSMLQGGLTGIVGTSYTAEDDDINAVEGDYIALETGLRQQINNIESDYPGYDEYRYFVDEIGHDPFELASYLTAKFHDYTPAEVQAELQALFGQQYTLTIQEVVEVRYRTETRTGTNTYTDPETGESYTEDYEYEVEVPYNYYILSGNIRVKPDCEFEDISNYLLDN